MNIKNIVKGVLKVAEAGAVVVIPGAAAVDQVAHSIADSKDNTEDDIEAAILAGLEELEVLNPNSIYDYPSFKANAQIAVTAVKNMIAATKKPDVSH